MQHWLDQFSCRASGSAGQLTVIPDVCLIMCLKQYKTTEECGQSECVLIQYLFIQYTVETQMLSWHFYTQSSLPWHSIKFVADELNMILFITLILGEKMSHQSDVSQIHHLWRRQTWQAVLSLSALGSTWTSGNMWPVWRRWLLGVRRRCPGWRATSQQGPAWCRGRRSPAGAGWAAPSNNYTTTLTCFFLYKMVTVRNKNICWWPIVWFLCSDCDPGCDWGGARAGPAAYQEQVQSALWEGTEGTGDGYVPLQRIPGVSHRTEGVSA